MPLLTVPYNNRTLADLLANKTNPITDTQETPIADLINGTIVQADPVIPLSATGGVIIPDVIPLNTTLLPTATQTLGPLFTNGTEATATSFATGFATGTGTGLSTAVPTISGFPSLTNITSNITANASDTANAYVYKRAPMPPLHPHIPSYMADQDREMPEGGPMAFIKRTAASAGTPSIFGTHMGIFLTALLGFLICLGGLWYVRSVFMRRSSAAAARVEADATPAAYTEKEPTEGPAWHSRFFRRFDAIPAAGRAEQHEAGLRAAMGGNWNSSAEGARGSWETQRTAPPAYHGRGLMDEKREDAPGPAHAANARFV